MELHPLKTGAAPVIERHELPVLPLKLCQLDKRFYD